MKRKVLSILVVVLMVLSMVVTLPALAVDYQTTYNQDFTAITTEAEAQAALAAFWNVGTSGNLTNGALGWDPVNGLTTTGAWHTYAQTSTKKALANYIFTTKMKASSAGQWAGIAVRESLTNSSLPDNNSSPSFYASNILGYSTQGVTFQFGGSSPAASTVMYVVVRTSTAGADNDKVYTVPLPSTGYFTTAYRTIVIDDQIGEIKFTSDSNLIARIVINTSITNADGSFNTGEVFDGAGNSAGTFTAVDNVSIPASGMIDIAQRANILAINSLKVEEQIAAELDRTLLLAAINTKTFGTLPYYTSESYTNYQNALVAAKATYNKPNAIVTQEQIDTAATNLNNAIEALVAASETIGVIPFSDPGITVIAPSEIKAEFGKEGVLLIYTGNSAGDDYGTAGATFVVKSANKGTKTIKIKVAMPDPIEHKVAVFVNQSEAPKTIPEKTISFTSAQAGTNNSYYYGEVNIPVNAGDNIIRLANYSGNGAWRVIVNQIEVFATQSTTVALEAKLAEAQLLVESDYISGWAELQNAIQAGLALMQQSEVTLQQADEAVANIDAAMNGLISAALFPPATDYELSFSENFVSALTEPKISTDWFIPYRTAGTDANMFAGDSMAKISWALDGVAGNGSILATAKSYQNYKLETKLKITAGGLHSTLALRMPNVEKTFTATEGDFVYNPITQLREGDSLDRAGAEGIMFTLGGSGLLSNEFAIVFKDGKPANAFINGASVKTGQQKAEYVIKYPTGVDITKDTDITIYDMDDVLYVYIAGKPVARIELSNLVDNVYTSGSVYNSKNQLVGTPFNNMVIERAGNIAFGTRTSNIYVNDISISELFAPRTNISEVIFDGADAAVTINSNVVIGSAKLVLALYDNDGELICARVNDVEVGIGDVESIYLSLPEGAAKAKVMLLDGLTSLKPLARVYEKPSAL